MVNLPPTCLSSPLYPWLMWNLWKARNLFVFEDRSFSEAETVLKAIKDAKEWQDAQKVSQPQVKLPKVFQPPAPISEKFSCFVDAAWNGISGACGLGWCLKDSSDLTAALFPLKGLLFPLLLWQRHWRCVAPYLWHLLSLMWSR